MAVDRQLSENQAATGRSGAGSVGDPGGNIPIVTTAIADPVKLGLAASLARPGKNMTGIVSAGVVARLELLKEIIPSLRRCAVLLYPGSASEMI